MADTTGYTEISPLVEIERSALEVANERNIGGEDEFAEAELRRIVVELVEHCLLYTSPSPRDRQKSRMPSSA